MKKSGKALGALALSATLAMGCAVPAFAADEYGTDIGIYSDHTENLKQNDSVYTDVKIATMITNINVAVPLDVTIVADSAGTSVLHPSAGLKNYTNGAFDPAATTGYRIENSSSYPVAIKNIQVTDSSSGEWAVVASLNADNNTHTGTIGDLELTLEPSEAQSGMSGSNKTQWNEGNKGTGGALNLATALDASIDPSWIVERKVSDDEPSIMGLLLSGRNSILRNVNEGSILLGDASNPQDPDPVLADNAFRITYTVGAAKTGV